MVFTVLIIAMKKDIHPTNFRSVIFKDISNGEMFLIASTIDTEKTEKWTDGKEYPLYEIEVSSTSHPFYTGDSRIMDTAGRAERFRNRAAKAKADAGKKNKKVSKTEPVAEIAPEPVVEEVETPVEA
ncbi:MAG: large subunit ribosomal protein L31 [Planctomycetota bacterium]